MMFALARYWGGVEVHGSSKVQTLIFWNKPVYVADNSGVKVLRNPIEVYSGK